MAHASFEPFELDLQSAHPDVQTGAVILGHMY